MSHDEPIELGLEGGPLYMPGPYDDADAVVAQLERAVGPNGFTVMGGPGLRAEDESELW